MFGFCQGSFHLIVLPASVWILSWYSGFIPRSRSFSEKFSLDVDVNNCKSLCVALQCPGCHPSSHWGLWNRLQARFSWALNDTTVTFHIVLEGYKIQAGHQHISGNVWSVVWHQEMDSAAWLRIPMLPAPAPHFAIWNQLRASHLVASLVYGKRTRLALSYKKFTCVGWGVALGSWSQRSSRAGCGNETNAFWQFVTVFWWPETVNARQEAAALCSCQGNVQF